MTLIDQIKHMRIVNHRGLLTNSASEGSGILPPKCSVVAVPKSRVARASPRAYCNNTSGYAARPTA